MGGRRPLRGTAGQDREPDETTVPRVRSRLPPAGLRRYLRQRLRAAPRPPPAAHARDRHRRRVLRGRAVQRADPARDPPRRVAPDGTDRTVLVHYRRHRGRVRYRGRLPLDPELGVQRLRAEHPARRSDRHLRQDAAAQHGVLLRQADGGDDVHSLERREPARTILKRRNELAVPPLRDGRRDRRAAVLDKLAARVGRAPPGPDHRRIHLSVHQDHPAEVR